MKNLRKIERIGVFVAIMLACGIFAASVAAQETVTMPLADLLQLRRVAADGQFWKDTAADRADQIKETQQQRDNWKCLFESEKKRADEIQEGRIGESLAAVTDLKKANFELHNQHDADQREKADLKKDNIALRSSRKYYFGAGLTLGGIGGGYLGYKLGKGGIPGLPIGDVYQARQFQPARQFGVAFKF